MTAKTAYSIKEKITQNIQEISTQLGTSAPTLLLFFASTKYDLAKLGQELQKTYPKTQILGCSTAGELVTGKMLKNSVVAMAFEKDSISDIDVAVAENIKTENNLKAAFTQFEALQTKN